MKQALLELTDLFQSLTSKHIALFAGTVALSSYNVAQPVPQEPIEAKELAPEEPSTGLVVTARK